MFAPVRILLRLTILLRPASLVLLTALYVSPVFLHGWRTSWQRGPQAIEAASRRDEALRRAGYAAYAAPVCFQTALFAPLKWAGSDTCYISLTESQIRLIISVAGSDQLLTLQYSKTSASSITPVA